MYEQGKTRQKSQSWVISVFSIAYIVYSPSLIYRCQEAARPMGDSGLEEGLWGGCCNNELVHCFRAKSLPWASLELSHFPPSFQQQESETCSAAWPGYSFLSVQWSQWFSAWGQGKWTNSIGTEWNLLGNEWLQASGKAQMRKAMQ